MTVRWMIVGGGYTGSRLARTLVSRPTLAGDIAVTRRDREAARILGAELGVRGIPADLADLGYLTASPGSVVVCLAPPGPDPAREIANLVQASRSAAKIIYVSSTGVYGPGGGRIVDESWPIAPTTAAGRARAIAEAELATSTVPWISLRAAGIYGPGRGLVERVRAGTYRVVGDGTSHVARIHVVDLIAAILAAAESHVTGPVNVADDDPAPIGEVADAVAARLGLPPPPRVPVGAVPSEVAGMLTADRRIDNRRLREELDVALCYPSWRDALDEELAAPAPAPQH